VASNTAFGFGTGDFTVEFWLYPLVATSSWSIYHGTTTNSFIINTNSSSQVVARQYGVADLLTSSSALVINTWTHLAVTRIGTTLTIWLNGVSSGTVSNSTNFATTGVYIGRADTVTPYLNGYMSNLRVVKGTAVYTSAFTPPTAPVTAVNGTVLLANFTNAGIYNDSMQHSVSTVSGARVIALNAKYGTVITKFDGNGDYLTTPTTARWNLPGDFTVEAWIYLNAAGVDYSIAGKWSASNYAWILQYMGATGPYIRFYPGNSGALGTAMTFSITLVAGVWYLVAVTRVGSNVNCFVNGTQVGSTATNSNNLTSTSGVCAIGYNPDGGVQYFNGYIQDLRITNGIARYIGNYTGNYLGTVPTTVEMLVVAGGGGGQTGTQGVYNGAGGGAGGYIYNAAVPVSSTSYTITIGAGGGGQTQGSNSVAFSYTAIGGGGAPGGSGGSGGGGQGNGGGGGAATAGQGNVGGQGGAGGGGAGGGGAGAAGGNEAAGYVGGVGLYFSQFANAGGYPGGWFAGGGAGTSAPASNGGGGAWGTATASFPGEPNTGGGGGGGYSVGNRAGGAGGSGVVIISYPSTFIDLIASPGLVYTLDTTARPGYKTYKFISGTGTIKWLSDLSMLTASASSR
jgi:hypothetical protein